MGEAFYNGIDGIQTTPSAYAMSAPRDDEVSWILHNMSVDRSMN